MADAYPFNRHVADDWGVLLVKGDSGITVAPID